MVLVVMVTFERVIIQKHLEVNAIKMKNYIGASECAAKTFF